MEEKILARVRGLLAKAESTEFPSEAEALTAKAAELIARYGIDQALLAASGHVADEIITIELRIDNPYAMDKRILMNCIATALRCKPISTPRYHRHIHDNGKVTRKTLGYSTVVVGHRSDLERFEILYTSLLLQATTQLATIRPNYGNVRTYRSAWFVGFAAEVGKRLKAAEEQAVAETPEPASGASTALVLVDRAQAVDNAYGEMFPDAVAGRTVRRSSGRGYRDGTAAGQRADLGNGRVGGRKAAIGRG
jgi:hypothetical protein